MEMSTRIQYYRECVNNPLYREYLNELNKIRVYPLLKKILIIMQLVYTILTVVLFMMISSNSKVITYWFVCVGLGILNLIGIGCYRYFDLDFNSKEYKQRVKELRKKYSDKGLYVFEYRDLICAGCGELNSNDIHVCSVTKEPLTYTKWTWCGKTKNCEECETFLTAIHQ